MIIYDIVINKQDSFNVEISKNINKNNRNNINNGVLVMAFDYSGNNFENYKVINLFIRDFDSYTKINKNLFNNIFYEKIKDNILKVYENDINLLLNNTSFEKTRLLITFKINIIKYFNKFNIKIIPV